MPRLLGHLSRHSAAALAVVAASLAAPVLTGDEGVRGTATNVTGFAAQTAQDVQRPGAELFPVDSPAFQEAQRAATDFWGAQACGGQVALAWKALDPGTNATASWRNPTDAWANPGENFDCVIDLNTNVDFDLPKLCTVLAHEPGHLLGHPHAEQPGQLMSPVYSSALPGCAGLAPATAPAPAPAPVAAPAAQQQPAPAALTRTRKATAKTTVTAGGVVKASDRGGKRALRRTKNRCVRTLQAGTRGTRGKRCARIARRGKPGTSRTRL